MKVLLFSISLTFSFLMGVAQTPLYVRKAIAEAKALEKAREDSIQYPIRGFWAIGEEGYGTYKNLELLIYDANNRLVYSVTQSLPTSSVFKDLIEKMIDKKYTAYMMKNGHKITERKNFGSFFMDY
ncbi:MAG TPA: hypothetical protein VK766_02285 [Cytophagaceae bacterium]|jgi:hypothetical protein|nr:hypothetical protein [Cytophagaceae bacterium]